LNQPSIGVILAQIGTPDAPTAKSVRPYLRRFLSDRRIIDYPPLLWQPLLRGIILRVRPRRSAKLYSEIWLKEGSPLLLHSQAQVAGLQKLLGSRYQVELGLAYSEPGMEQAFARLESSGVTRIIVVPLFPQYSSTTTASVYDAACFAALGRRSAAGPVSKRFVPALRFMEAYYNAPG
jgi:protoporphyrin/coproporphyrin ferrochelatase